MAAIAAQPYVQAGGSGRARAFAAAEAAWRAALVKVTIADLVSTVGRDGTPEHLGKIMQWYGTEVRRLPSAG